MSRLRVDVPLRAKAILSRSEARMDFAVPCRG